MDVQLKKGIANLHTQLEQVQAILDKYGFKTVQELEQFFN